MRTHTHMLCNPKKAGISPQKSGCRGCYPTEQGHGSSSCRCVYWLSWGGGHTGVTQITLVAGGQVPLRQGKKPVPRSLTLLWPQGGTAGLLLLSPGFGNQPGPPQSLPEPELPANCRAHPTTLFPLPRLCAPWQVIHPLSPRSFICLPFWLISQSRGRTRGCSRVVMGLAGPSRLGAHSCPAEDTESQKAVTDLRPHSKYVTEPSYKPKSVSLQSHTSLPPGRPPASCLLDQTFHGTETVSSPQ